MLCTLSSVSFMLCSFTTKLNWAISLSTVQGFTRPGNDHANLTSAVSIPCSNKSCQTFALSLTHWHLMLGNKAFQSYTFHIIWNKNKTIKKISQGCFTKKAQRSSSNVWNSNVCRRYLWTPVALSSTIPLMLWKRCGYFL